MKRIISSFLSLTLSISAILIFAGNIYSVKAEEVSINSFIEDGVKLICENDGGKEFIPEEIKKDIEIENDYDESVQIRSFAKNQDNEVEYSEKEEFSDTAFQTCRLIVKASETPDKLNSIGMASGFKDWYIVQFKNEKDVKTAYEKYLSEDYVLSVSPDIVVDLSFEMEKEGRLIKTETDENITRLNSWGSIETGLYDVKDYIENNVWNKKEIVVGVIDGGIDSSLPFFEDRIIRNYVSTDEGSDIFHGTQVSATIVDNTNENVKIAMYKLAYSFSEAAITSPWLCFLKAVNDNVNIINCSFLTKNRDIGIWRDALSFAESKQIAVFAGAGNDSEKISFIPAAFESVYTVAAYGLDGLPCSWSSYGKEVDFLAPGDDIPLLYMEGETEIGETGYGTSLSCPLAVSEFALLMTLFPDKSNEQIIELMKKTCKLTDVIYDYALYGCGVIDAIGASGIERNKKPQFNLPEGKYIGDTKVEITADPGCDIYYTLDGSYPSKENGKKYDSQITLPDSASILKAVAYGNGVLQSECVKSRYRIQHIGTDDMFEITNDGQITEYTGNVCDLIIPETIKGITVLSIAPRVFKRAELTGVSFPNTMTKVSEMSFCDNGHIMFADGYGIREIDASAFENCENLCHLDFPLAEVIGEKSFKDDVSLEEAIFPMCVKINKYAFLNCTSLKYINLPKIEYIGIESFGGCNCIWDINISNVSVFQERFGGGNTFFNSKVFMPLDLPNLKQATRRSFYNGSFSRIEFSNIEEITSLPDDSFYSIYSECLVLPSTLISCNLNGLTEDAIIYGSCGTYAKQWANENGFEFIEILPETAIINDLPYEFYDNMHYLYADVVGFNRTYQWYGSYTNQNIDGTLIEGATERRFVPKENEQYPYYYCVVTSTDKGYDPIEIRTGSSRYMEFNGEMPNADYSALDDILATVPEDLSIYTDESVAALNEIINNIDRNLDVSNQATVNGYVEAISNALLALKLKEHMVSFIVDNKPILSYELEYDSEITEIPPNPDKTGYTFSKWTPDIPQVMPNNSLAFTAEFEPVTYYASFMVGDEEIEKVPFTVESESISEPKIPEKEGYTGKWSEYIIAASDITINAEYIINEYTVDFVADDKIIKSDIVEFGSPIEVPDNPQKDGYIFKEWLPKVPETMPAKDMTFYAVFEEEKQPEINPDISIMNFVSSRTVDYRTTITFTAVAGNLPEGATIVWYKDGQRAGTGETFTVADAKEAFTVQARIVDDSGNTLNSTETELVKVKTDFFSKIIAFFIMLFGKLPIIEQ